MLNRNDPFRTEYLQDVQRRFQSLKELGEGAIKQVADADLGVPLGPEENSLAIQIQHLAGNMRSRWTDFLTSDGEKPERNRDAEFDLRTPPDREILLARWEGGWDILFQTLAALTPEDLDATVRIRGEPHSVVEAVNRKLSHYAYHVGQMVLISRHFVGSEWTSLSISRWKSEDYNRKMSKN